MRALCVVLIAAVGCGEGERVVLHLDIPEDPALDPFTLDVAELILTASADGERVFKESRPRPAPGQTLDFGRIPYGDGLTFELSGVTPADRVVAFGRSALPADVVSGARVDVDLVVRRPFAYVAGADAVLAIDGTGEPGDAYASMLPLGTGGAVSALATTPDGRHLVAVVGADQTELIVVSTADHAATAHTPVALPGPATELAMSPDGQTVAALHAAPAGVSIVDLAAVIAGDAVDARFVTTSAPADVAMSNDQIWVVQDPPNFFCVGESTVLPIDVASATSGVAIALDVGAGDAAYDPDSGRVFVAAGCADTVLAIEDGVLVPSPLPNVRGPSALGIARGRLWAMGHADGDDAHLILASVPLTGSGEIDVLDLPPLEDRALATALSETGQDALIRMTPDLASAVDLTVMPDGQHVGIIVAAISITKPTGDAGNGQPIIPEIRMITFEYQLAQLDTGLAAQRLRVSCAIEWDPGALLDDFACSLAPGQDELPIDFAPGGVTALFGSR